MSGKLYVSVLLLLATLSRAESYKFSITKNLENDELLEKNFWSHVEIKMSSSEENVDVHIDIPKSLCSSCSSVRIFFANDVKEILEVSLGEKIEGRFYGIPYRLEKVTEGMETKKETNGEFFRISGDFPRSWLPKGCSKVSATVSDDSGACYNYYGIKNYKISIPDLMVVEEFNNYNCDL